MRQIVFDVGGEGLVEALSDRTGRAGIAMAGDFTDGQQCSIGGGNEDLVGGEQIGGAERRFLALHSGTRANFEQNAARDSFETAGVERRRQHAAGAHAEKIRSGAFSNFATFIEQHNFIETGLLGLVKIPDIVEPGGNFHAGERRGCVAPMFAEIEAGGLAKSRQVGAAQEQVNEWKALVAAPVADLIVNGVNARAAFGNAIGTDDLEQIAADFFGVEGKRAVGSRGVALEAFPMALEGERDAIKNMQSGEQTPAVEQASLAGGHAAFFDGHEFVVVKNESMEHCASPSRAIVAQSRVRWVKPIHRL